MPFLPSTLERLDKVPAEKNIKTSPKRFLLGCAKMFASISNIPRQGRMGCSHWTVNHECWYHFPCADQPHVPSEWLCALLTNHFATKIHWNKFHMNLARDLLTSLSLVLMEPFSFYTAYKNSK